jgi:hypothetical protein
VILETFSLKGIQTESLTLLGKAKDGGFKKTVAEKLGPAKRKLHEGN